MGRGRSTRGRGRGSRGRGRGRRPNGEGRLRPPAEDVLPPNKRTSWNWIELPEDILMEIFARLGNLHDRRCFSRVCHSWRYLANSVKHPPCLILPQKLGSIKWSLLTYPYLKTIDFELPEMQGKHLYPTSRGSWFLVLGLDPSLVLFNPITHSQIFLPPLTAIDAVQFDASKKDKEYSVFKTARNGRSAYHGTYSLQNARDTFIWKVVMSSSSEDPLSEIVMIVLTHSHKYIYFCKPGGKQWLLMPHNNSQGEISDLAYSSGNFYILDNGGQIQAVSCSELNSILDPTKLSLRLFIIPDDPLPTLGAYSHCLIGSKKGLFLIRTTNYQKPNFRVDVFSLQTSPQHEPVWQRMNCVNDLAFFMYRIDNCGLSVSTMNAVHKLDGNRVYFPRIDYLDKGYASVRCNINMYDISNNSTRRWPTGLIVSSRDVPFYASWVIPSFD